MTTAGPVRVAVVGAGRMGTHHARVYSQMPECQLVGVCDPVAASACKVTGQYGGRAFASVAEMLAANVGVQAATIAVPTIYHRNIAEELLRAGVDILIEKPLAPNVEDGSAIVQLARAQQRVLQVGHSERFNPAVLALEKYALKPKFIEVHRISPMTFRSIDIGVVLDMMIHDLDIVNHLVKCPARDVVAVGVGVIGRHEDIANARITFTNGCVANITASRLALKTERKMRLFSPDAYVSVDYARKSGSVITRTANEAQLELVRQQVASGQIADLAQLNYPELVKYEELQIQDKEPLRAEQEAFIAAVKTRGIPPVTGEDGLAAVDLAVRIAQSIGENTWEGMPVFASH